MLAAVDPYATKVLTPELHGRLVANIDHFAADAGIQKHWLWTPVAPYLGEAESEYVKTFHKLRREGMVKGLVMTRKTAEADPFERMSAMAAVFTRNFVRARLMTLQHVLGILKEGDSPEATVLLIPNFFHSKDEGGTILPWQAGVLYDLMLQRAAQGKHTAIYATGVDEMGASYGSAFARFVSSHYLKAEI